MVAQEDYRKETKSKVAMLKRAGNEKHCLVYTAVTWKAEFGLASWIIKTD